MLVAQVVLAGVAAIIKPAVNNELSMEWVKKIIQEASRLHI